ncbi:MAG: histidine phosphatase family protein [bacterium]|nr:histidine phosphatase family protein [bacterium]
MKLKNNYFLLRHGESLKNVQGFESSWPEKKRVPLTKRGKEQIAKIAKEIAKKKISLIFCSDLLRTRQTAEIVGKIIGVKPIIDKRLREIGLGIFNGKSVKEFGSFWNKGEKLSATEHYKRRFKMPLPKGETYEEVEARLSSLIRELEKEYQGENILLVSHQRPLTLLEKTVKNYSLSKFVKMVVGKKEIKTGELRKL